MMEDDNNVMWNAGTIDCTNIVNHVKESAKEDFVAVNEILKKQQSQIDDLLKSVQNVVNILSRPSTNTIVGPNVPDGTQPVTNGEVRPNVSYGTEPSARTKFDDLMSTNASNLWFGGNASVLENTGRDENEQPEDDKESDAPESSKQGDKTPVLQPDQAYWQNSLNDYEDDSKAIGEEISSSIAGAAKIYWQKPMKEEVFKKKMEEAKIPSNCPFLIPKRTNTEIWTTLSSFSRTTDVKIQEILTQHSAAVTMMLTAASELADSSNKKAMMALKEALSLSGKVSQSTNKLRRELMKPTLPKGYGRLASEAEETSEWLFGESVCERLEKLKKENKIKEILTKERNPKRKAEPLNENPSYKSQRRVEYRDQGHHQNRQNRDYRNKYPKKKLNYNQNKNNPKKNNS